MPLPARSKKYIILPLLIFLLVILLTFIFYKKPITTPVKTLAATISAVSDATTITVTSSDYDNSGSTGFKLVFDAAKGGTIDEFYHDSVGSGNTNIVSGNASYDALFDIAYGATTLSADSTATLSLLESSSAKVQVQAVANVTANDIATLDYTIYPNGKIYLKVSLEIHDGARNNTDNMFLLIQDYAGYQTTYSSVDNTNKAAALLPDADGFDAALIPYSASYVGTVDAAQSSGSDYIMLRFDSAASGYDDETTSVTSWFLDLSESTYNSSLLTNKRNDYRNPDTLSYSSGSTWQEVGSDEFNENQGAYTLNFASNQATFDIDGATYNRYSAFFKMRGWIGNSLPQYVNLEGSNLSAGTEYNLSFKPFSSSFFTQDLTFSSTLEDSASVTSPDVGTGTSVTNATFTTGKYGNGILVDATGEYASIPLSGNINAQTGTIELWYKETTNNTTNAFFFDSSEGVDQFALGRTTSSDNIYFDINDSADITWTTTINAFDGNWHHIRFTYDTNNDNYYLYIDGINQGQKTNAKTDITISTYNLIIGNSSTGSYGYPVNGIIDEFRIYNSVTTPVTIAKGGNTADSSEYLARSNNNYTLGFSTVDTAYRGKYLFFSSDSKFQGLNIDLATNGVESSTTDVQWEYWSSTGSSTPPFPFINDPNLQGLWYMEEDGNNNATDLSSNGYHLIVSDGDTIPRTSDKIQGSYARDFERDDQDFFYRSDASSPNLDITSDITLCTWAKFETVDSSNGYLIAKYDTSTNQRAYALNISGQVGTGDISFYISGNGTSASVAYTAAGSVTTNTWYHICGVYDSAAQKVIIYRDGVVLNNGSYNPLTYSSGIYNSSADFRLGARSGSTSYLDGLIDEVAVFNRALSASEIYKIYDTRKTSYGWKPLLVSESAAGASKFKADGAVYFTAPSDWQLYSTNGSSDQYYLRAHLHKGGYSTSPVENLIYTDILNLHYLGNITADGQTFMIPGPAPTNTPTPTPTLTPTPGPASVRLERIKLERIKIN